MRNDYKVLISQSGEGNGRFTGAIVKKETRSGNGGATASTADRNELERDLIKKFKADAQYKTGDILFSDLGTKMICTK